MYIPYEKVSSFMFENFENVTISDNINFHARCPICGDSKKNKLKKRFYLNYNNGFPLWYCHNCDRGNNETFIQLYCLIKNIDYNTAIKELIPFDEKNLKDILIDNVKKDNIIKNNTTINYNYIIDDCLDKNSIPNGYFEKVLQKKLINFIKERNIPDKYNILIAYKGKFKNRIIIPIIEDDNIIYFQARTLSTSNNISKYINPENSNKNEIIFNKNNFKRNKYIIVVEGLFDAFSIGDQSTCLLGSSLNMNFINKLLEYTDKNVIICYDNDKTGLRELNKKLNDDKFKNLRFFIMPHKYKDIKDMNELLIKFKINNLYDFIVNNSYSYFESKIKIELEV